MLSSIRKGKTQFLFPFDIATEKQKEQLLDLAYDVISCPDANEDDMKQVSHLISRLPGRDIPLAELKTYARRFEHVLKIDIAPRKERG